MSSSKDKKDNTGFARYGSRFESLRKRYLAQLPERLAELEAAWQRDSEDELRRILHSFIGLAGNFGLEEVSANAAACRELLSSAERSSALPLVEKLANLIRAEID